MIGSKLFKKMYPDFDSNFYRKNYRDLSSFNDYQLMEHYYKYGKNENRISSEKDLKELYGKNIDFIKKQNIEKFDLPENTKFNILIRTSNRKDNFMKCIKSIYNQSYKNYEIFVSYDNKSDLEYLKDINNKYLMDIIKKGDCYYNEYLNLLIDEVKNGWIIILDDDCEFSNNNVLNYLNYIIYNTFDDILIWKFGRPDKIIYPSNINLIKFTEITMCSFAFKKEILTEKNKFKQIKGGDFEFISNLKGEKRFIDYIFVNTNYSNCINLINL